MTRRNPTAAELALARKCAAAAYSGLNALQKCALIDGQWDDAPAVQAALLAIMETTDRAEKLAYSHADMNAGSDEERIQGAEYEAIAIATALGRGDHLKEGV